jgi:hypothetical protein
MWKRVLPLALAALLVALVAVPSAHAGSRHRSRRSAATITASFADSCRDFATHSSKDISHVVFHYADGRVVKDERICGHDYAVDGEAGDEIEFATVKSGTTTEQFDCEQSNGAPTALLEIQTPPIEQTFDTCYDFFAGGLSCEQSRPRTDWTGRSEIPDAGGSESGFFHWGCGGFSDYSECPMAITFRGIGSHDPDGDIASWSLDFGDGTSVSGNWSTPPTEVTHEYLRGPLRDLYCTGYGTFGSNVCLVTLTVTDSAGQSHSDAIVMGFLDQAPD